MIYAFFFYLFAAVAVAWMAERWLDLKLFG